MDLALPVLEEFGAPALFFVSTHHVLTGGPFWFDRVITPIQVASTRALDLRPFGLGRYRFRGRDGARRWDDIERLLTDIKRLGNPGEPPVDAILFEIESRCAGDRHRTSEVARPMRPAELQRLSKSRVAHFGAHGHRHEALTRLSDTDLETNLRRSRLELQRLIGRDVVDVAYPNGDVDDRVIRATRACGFARGYTTQTGVPGLGTDPLRLPRLLVGGYDTAADLELAIRSVVQRPALSDDRS